MNGLRFQYPKTYRLRHGGEFKRLRDLGSRVIGSSCRFQYRIVDSPLSQKPPRLGLTVPKKFGNSPQRNRFKRIVREIFRKERHRLPPSCEVNVSPNDWNQESSFEKMVADFEKFLLRANSSHDGSKS